MTTNEMITELTDNVKHLQRDVEYLYSKLDLSCSFTTSLSKKRYCSSIKEYVIEPPVSKIKIIGTNNQTCDNCFGDILNPLYVIQLYFNGIDIENTAPSSLL